MPIANSNFDILTAVGSDAFSDIVAKSGHVNYEYNLQSPGMPPAGPSFINLVDTIAPSGSDKNYWLNYYYMTATYSDDFGLNVLYKKEYKPTDFVPGHLFGEHRVKPACYGPTPADVMIIGKLPGFEEGMYKINFTGPSGLALRQSLQELGIDETKIYVTNAIKFPHLDKRSTAFPQTWLKDCAPILQLELRIVQPKFILCVGTEATQAILGKGKNVTNTIGSVFDIEFPILSSDKKSYVNHSAKVITCVHPAAVIRTPDLYPQFMDGLSSFKKLIDNQPVGVLDRDLDHRIVDNEDDLKKIVDEVLSDPDSTNIAVDAEWHGEHPFEPGAYLRTVQFSHKPKFACCVVLRNTGGSDCFKPNIDAAFMQLKRILKSTEQRRVRIIGHFFRSDLPWLIYHGLDLRPEFAAPVDCVAEDGRSILFGWQQTKTRGGFDTGLSAHSVHEASRYKLEVVAASLLGTPRYDFALQKWKEEYCKENKLGAKDLEGYGMVPNSILFAYANHDVSVTRRLFDVFNGTDDKSGLLDADQFGNSCREAFWTSMRSSPAFLEMEMSGISLDIPHAEDLTQVYRDAEAILLEDLRQSIKWPDFNPASDHHRRELIFGEQYHHKYDDEGKAICIRPEGATCLYLPPIKTTGKPAKPWEVVVRRRETDQYSPSCDKEVLGILSSTSSVVKKLRDLRFISHILHSVLRRPKIDDAGQEERDEEGNLVFEKGFIALACSDSRIRPRLWQTAESARAKCSSPNLMAISHKREADYKRILGPKYKAPLRSILKAAPGHVLIEADYSGAEVLMTALMANDPLLIDHAKRSALPENHKDYYDIHSNIAVSTFRLDCVPTKSGLKSIGKAHLRTAAKSVFFGYAYGQGPEAAARKAQEEGADVTAKDAAALMDGLRRKYIYLEPYFTLCRSRVHDPGWICNIFGRYRRCNPSAVVDKQAVGEVQRQYMNFCSQSGIADVMNRALDFLMMYKENHLEISYKLIMQIHDAVLLEVPIQHISEVWHKVLPICMVNSVPIYPCHLDGSSRGDGPYHLSIGKQCFVRWGEQITTEVAKKLSLPDFVLESH